MPASGLDAVTQLMADAPAGARVAVAQRPRVTLTGERGGRSVLSERAPPETLLESELFGRARGAFTRVKQSCARPALRQRDRGGRGRGPRPQLRPPPDPQPRSVSA